LALLSIASQLLFGVKVVIHYSFFRQNRYSTLLYSTLLYATLCYSTLLYATLRYSTLLYATLRYSTLLYATLLYATLLYSTLLYATLRYSTLLYATLRSLHCRQHGALVEERGLLKTAKSCFILTPSSKKIINLSAYQTISRTDAHIYYRMSCD
jgi:uncharacterized protein YjbI with pentapeptide repeats